jgi:hypothetical protein
MANLKKLNSTAYMRKQKMYRFNCHNRCSLARCAESNVKNDAGKRTVDITIGGKPFTTFVYTDTMEKPFLYPIYAPNGTTITRGFPWNPQPNDP